MHVCMCWSSGTMMLDDKHCTTDLSYNSDTGHCHSGPAHAYMWVQMMNLYKKFVVVFVNTVPLYACAGPLNELLYRVHCHSGPAHAYSEYR